MRGLLAGLALLTLAGCSSGDDASAAPKSEATAVAQPEDALPEDATPDTAQKYLTALTNPPQPGPWHPRDACVDQPGALEFREKLAAAVMTKDSEGVAALADKAIVLDFGGGSGIKELKKRLADPETGLWKALQNVIPLGCAVQGTSLTMPWYFAQDIPVDDPYVAMIVKGVDVPLLDAPKAEAKVLARLSWDVVELQKDPGTFAQVKAADGKAGFVETAKLRALIDYRLIAEKQAEGWKLTAFVAGD